MALVVAQTLSAQVARIPFKATTKILLEVVMADGARRQAWVPPQRDGRDIAEGDRIQLLIDPTGSILLDPGGNAIGVIYPPS
ncbi:MAG: hypothetical protein ABSC46_06665 [Candidatus Limnocylindrales bacterium]